ncbi:hypothetical protein ACFVYA_23110 [Amycolatopsis sp. NPDC058278]
MPKLSHGGKVLRLPRRPAEFAGPETAFALRALANPDHCTFRS